MQFGELDSDDLFSLPGEGVSIYKKTSQDAVGNAIGWFGPDKDVPFTFKPEDEVVYLENVGYDDLDEPLGLIHDVKMNIWNTYAQLALSGLVPISVEGFKGKVGVEKLITGAVCEIADLMLAAFVERYERGTTSKE